MATRGWPGEGGANERKPVKVGSSECLKGGSWIAIIKGGCGSIVKI